MASPSKLPPIFDAAEAIFGDACYVNHWGLPLEESAASDECDANLRQESLLRQLTVAYLKDVPPERVELLEEASAPVAVARSPIHGLGIFATRDIAMGEVVELTPSLPIEGGNKIDPGILDSYTFDLTPRIDMLQLGLAAIYNHSDAPNVSHIKYRESPYLEAWVAEVDIEAGEELFHDYGPDYFDTRDMRKLGEHRSRLWPQRLLGCAH